MEEAKQLMLSQYIPWVNSTYGDTAKTKTITKKKYSRIIALLRFNAEQKDTKNSTNNNNGSSINSINDATSPQLATLGGGNGGSELAKFKLWVKSKGFHLGPPEGHPDYGNQETENTLYLPTGTDKVSVNTNSFLTILNCFLYKCSNVKFCLNSLFYVFLRYKHIFYKGRTPEISTKTSFINMFSLLYSVSWD